jgi:hypothetical protein
VNFFYGTGGGSPPLAKLFPDDFRTSIPAHAVAMAMTCVGNLNRTEVQILIILYRYTIVLMNTEQGHEGRTTLARKIMRALMRQSFESFH